MQFSVFFVFFFNLYINIGTRYIPNENLWYIIGNRIETRQKVNAGHCSGGIHQSIYLCLIINLIDSASALLNQIFVLCCVYSFKN